MKKKILSAILACALLLSVLPIQAGAAGGTIESDLHGTDIFLHFPEQASWLEKGLRLEDWAWGYKILYYLLWPGAQLFNLLWPPLRPLILRIAEPLVDLFNPDLPDFVPAPEPAPPQAAKHSIAGYRIFYGGTGPDKTAADLLAKTLNTITQTSAFVTETGTPAASDAFVIGIDTALGDDEYRIEPDTGGTVITITGGKRGVLYGVHRLLEKYFDCHWYTPALQVIPTGAAEIADVAGERYAPQLQYRETDWLHPATTDYYAFSVANGLNGNQYRSLPESQGGTFGYNGSFAHTIINRFVRPGTFFAAHPDWYAWREKEQKRVEKQLCLTNPEVLAQMITEVGAIVNNGGIISITQDDNQDYCQCASCKAVDAAEGSHAGTMIRFINAVAAVYPTAMFDTFAYQYTRTPTKITQPRDNVIVRLCSIECCFAHALDDPKCAENVKFANDLRAWSSISKHLYIWDYTTNYAHYNCIFPNFGVIQANLKFFLANKVKGVYEEGNYQAAASNSEFADLRKYLLARLLFNPNIDYSAEMNGFLKAYYGGGWQYMREFMDLTIANAGKAFPHKKMGIYISPYEKDLLCLKLNQIRYADKLWAKAAELAGSGACEQNVLRSQLCWRFWKGCAKAIEFWRLREPAVWQTANEQLYNDFVSFGITQYREGGATAAFKKPADWWGTPADWR